MNTPKPLENFKIPVEGKKKLFNNTYEHGLYNFIKSESVDSRVFSLNYILNLDVFKRLQKRDKLTQARNELIRQGFLICIHNCDLESTLFNDWFNDFEIEFDPHYGERFLSHSLKFPHYDNEWKGIVNISCFDTRIGFNANQAKIKRGANKIEGIELAYERKGIENQKDEFGNTWVFEWEQKYNIWLKHYFPLIQNNL